MNMHSYTASARRMRSASRRWQRGDETVEFAMLAGLIFLMFFALIEFSIGMYNYGVLIHAGRVGAQEASLYWVNENWVIDPANDPPHDQQLSTDEVDRKISEWSESYLVKFPTDAAPTVELLEQPIDDWPSAIAVNPGDEVDVRLSWPYTALISSRLMGLLAGDGFDAINMTALGVMRVE